MSGERLLDADAVELFRRVHEARGAGPVRNYDWWQMESAHLASDWPGILRYGRRSSRN
jgi:hypothetical protein